MPSLAATGVRFSTLHLLFFFILNPSCPLSQLLATCRAEQPILMASLSRVDCNVSRRLWKSRHRFPRFALSNWVPERNIAFVLRGWVLFKSSLGLLKGKPRSLPYLSRHGESDWPKNPSWAMWMSRLQVQARRLGAQLMFPDLQMEAPGRGVKGVAGAGGFLGEGHGSERIALDA